MQYGWKRVSEDALSFGLGRRGATGDREYLHPAAGNAVCGAAGQGSRLRRPYRSGPGADGGLFGKRVGAGVSWTG